MAGSRGSCSAPPRPASKAPSANTAVNSQAWLTPSAPTISRSCVAARTSVPQRVRVSSSQSSAEHERADDDQEQVVGRERLAEDVDRAGQARRARAEQVLRAPDPQRGVLDDQHQREGGEQLEQLGRAVDAAQQQHLDQRAEHADRERREQHAGQKPSGRPPSRSTSVYAT